MNELGTPNVKPTWLALVNLGAAPKATVVKVKVCVAVSPEGPVAVIKNLCVVPALKGSSPEQAPRSERVSCEGPLAIE